MAPDRPDALLPGAHGAGRRRGHLGAAPVPAPSLSHMTTEGAPGSRRLQLHCRIDIAVTDPAALTGHAVAELRAADIDWAQEEDDLPSADAELRGDLTLALASVADLSRVVDGVPGVEFRGGVCWAETGPPRASFAPTGGQPSTAPGPAG